MKIEVYPDAQTVAEQAAKLIAAAAREAVAARGQFNMAVSGGTTPWQMLRALAGEEVPWQHVHLFQVDERIAPAGSAERNLTHMLECLSAVPLPPHHLHPMPVEATDLPAACEAYLLKLQQQAGAPPVLDLAHLGLGPDGHTASLVPGDAVLKVTDRDVALTGGEYQGRHRMTLTYPILDRARQILWLVTGESKVEMLARLRDHDPSIPAGRVASQQAIVLADQPAAAKL